MISLWAGFDFRPVVKMLERRLPSTRPLVGHWNGISICFLKQTFERVAAAFVSSVHSIILLAAEPPSPFNRYFLVQVERAHKTLPGILGTPNTHFQLSVSLPWLSLTTAVNSSALNSHGGVGGALSGLTGMIFSPPTKAAVSTLLQLLV